MKIAVFVTDFPLHLVCWLCDILDGLAAREVEIDLFLYKAGQPPRFRQGIRVIPLPEDVKPGLELVAEAAINAVRKIASGVPYDACIGFESRALLLAKVAADAAKCPLIHHSFELYEPTYPGVWQKDFAELKRLEERLIREVDLFLIQDAEREREYFRILGTENRPRNTMYLPVSLPRLSSTAKPRHWHQEYNLPPDTRVVFYIGQLAAGRFVDQMIVAAQSFRDDQQLIVHGPFFNNTAALKQLVDLDAKRRVIFSTEIIPWDQVARMSASADIGLVFYRSHYINEFTTGRSSDKLARYLQSGIPAICSDFPSFRREIDRFRFGECCSDFARMPELVSRICDDYAGYQDGARRAFEEVYNLDLYMNNLVPILRRLGRDKRRISDSSSIFPLAAKMETEASVNQSSLSGQSFDRNGGSIPYGPRTIHRSTESDPNRILAKAREFYECGRFDDAFDLYEQLSMACAHSAVEILAELYDLYRRIPNPDRYVLYQSRCFNFGIKPGDKVLDIGSGNVPFRLATHLADLTTQDNQLGRAGAPFKYLDGKPVIQCDITRMPFADKEFDFAYCSHVLEHVDDPAQACRELMRIAKRGYIETPSPAKDLWLDTIAVSNHRWAVECIGGKLVFTEYAPAQKIGLQNSILRDMHCDPQTPREKAFAALVYLKADRMNTLLLWDRSFEFEVRRLPQDKAGPVQSVAPAAARFAAVGNPTPPTAQTLPAAERSPDSSPISNAAPSSTIPVVQGWPLSRIGTDYGGAMIDPELVPIGGTVISAGVGEDISFDLELIRLRNCMVIGIDPTEKAAQFVSQNPHPRFQFLQRALTEKGRSTVRMYKSANPNYVSESVVLSHKTVAPEQSYEAQTVCLDELLRAYPEAALLKLDIEGAEYAVLNSVQYLEIPQLYIEFHHFCTGFTIHDTMHCIQRLTRMGYVVAHTAARAAPLQQVTFIHSKCLSEKSTQQAIQQDRTCAVV